MEAAQKLKILYVITKANFGGAQRYVHDLALAARDGGHDVAVAFGGDGTLARRLAASGIRTLCVSSLQRDISPGADLKAFFALYRIIRDESPDVVHLNSSKVGALGALAARLLNLVAVLMTLLGKAGHRIATVFTGHGWAFNEERSALSRFVLGFLHWLTIQLSHCVIAVSDVTRAQVLRLPFVRRKVVVVHNGVGDVPLLDPDEAWARIVASTPWEGRFARKPPLVVGMLAELHNNKGLSYAIDAASTLRARLDRPFRLVILGEGEQRAALEEQIRRLGLEDTVLLAGFRAGGNELLRAFDVFLMSSITEALPYAVLEAGNAALPIVATRVGGVPDVIEDMRDGILVPSRSADAIATALERLLARADERARLASGAHARVVESFSLGRMVARTFSIYDVVHRRLLGTPAALPEPVEEKPDRSGVSLGPSP